ncbi:MAG: T9SS type A sorting domain-containing protein, partial [Chlamydiia bacterium]|nr:T9SS type A sorting domain-containing protein [Chlamydiia bacterium]
LTDNGNGTAVINVSDQSTLGNHSIEVLVTADSNSDTETFNLEVKAPFVNTPPVLDPIGTLYAKTGVAKDFDISATDVDAGDVLVFSISGNPSFVTLSDNNDGTAVISVSDVAPEGVHENILITVTDGTGNDTETISVSVSAATVGGAYYCDPINGSMSNDGTSEATAWTTLEAVFSANKTFDDGDVIYLMNGDHGSTQIKSSNTDYVKITAYAGHNPIITKILFSSGASYWVVDNLKFEGFGVNSMSSAGLVNTYAGSDNITVSNCYFISVEDSKVFDYSNGTTEAIWKNQTSSGVKVTGDNTVVENCTFYNIHFGILLNGNNMKIENNLIDNFYADGIQIQGGGNNAIINGNTIRDAYVVDAQHDDGIQFWTNIGDGKIENVRITNNKVFNFADEITPELEQYGLVSEVMQGIILTDGWASNWVVENNLVVNSHTHGITIPGANNCRIQNNTNVKNPQLKDYVSSTSDPIIQTPTATKPSVKIPANSIVRNNLGTKIATWAFPGNFTVEGNYDIEQDDYNNYLACFVDYENQDFHLKETSPAVDTGSNNDLIAADLDGNDRLFGTKVDAGCYEYGSSPSSNVAPVLAPIGTISAIEGEAKSIAISATDANDDVLTFSILKGDKEFISLVDNGDGTASIEISDQSVTSIFTIEIKVFDGKLYDSEIVTIKIDNTLSTIENDLASFKIYPNPVKGNDINISFTKSSKEEQTVQLVSLTGRVVYSSIIVKGETKHQINNVEDLSQGVYLLQIGSSTKSTTKKVIID